jgi:signal transduction histidine kinase
MRSSRSFLLLSLCVSCAIQTAGTHGAATSIAVWLDGREIQVHDGTLEVPRNVTEMAFRIGDGKELKRVRYQFEGVDPTWIERPGEMNLYVQFYDKAGDQTFQKIFSAKGTSPGWRTTVEDSTFVQRRESLDVPPDAESVCLVFSSAGAPTAMGIYVFDNVVVSQVSQAGASQEVLVGNPPSIPSAKNEDPAYDVWKKGGLRPSMAQTIMLGKDALSRRTFCIVDNDSSTHAEWRAIKKLGAKSGSGERLMISWSELYNIGDGNAFKISYRVPAAGRYAFKAEAVDSAGQPQGPENAIKVTVMLLFWEKRWFLLGCICLTGVLAAAGTQYVVRSRVRSRIRRLQQKHIVELERLRIARDIHDDLGAQLTNISLVSALAAQDDVPENAAANFQKISNMARDLVSALYETIWAVNPENDSLDNLITFICQSTQNLCGSSGLRCRIDTVKLHTNLAVTSEFRHNVVLVVKEAVHNAVKHAQATEIQIQIRFENAGLTIVIQDNGLGFPCTGDTSHPDSGHHGIKNMEGRVKLLRGTMQVASTSGRGTQISIWFPIP